ncbi:hypothetical protein SAMN05421788_110119 [Filimonas lacunae]|uniref:Uncharacterized protein n=1 Tax=Filimonas lacunae TaxID=477680 RepID=A0A173MA40_9BACT|nr:hypothetical protein [Filimonas lacunae]BAV04392.1 hypothetical protein FLA_0380 [Filimonas lacunae]SIT31262.1 hypothetical protein SAMN05421788_110119 [Filimonas lacunae]
MKKLLCGKNCLVAVLLSVTVFLTCSVSAQTGYLYSEKTYKTVMQACQAYMDYMYKRDDSSQNTLSGVKIKHTGRAVALSRQWYGVVVTKTDSFEDGEKRSETFPVTDNLIEVVNLESMPAIIPPTQPILTDRKGKEMGKFERGRQLIITDPAILLYGGNVIQLAPDKTTTITGTMDDVEVVALRGRTSDGKALNGITLSGEVNDGGVNILRSPRWGELKKEYGKKVGKNEWVYDWESISNKFWEEINEPWLEAAVLLGDPIRLESNPAKDRAIFVTDAKGEFVLSNGKKVPSIFGREVAYITSKGYKIQADGTAIKKELCRTILKNI